MYRQVQKPSSVNDKKNTFDLFTYNAQKSMVKQLQLNKIILFQTDWLSLDYETSARAQNVWFTILSRLISTPK